jgi:hypothetical protein
LAAFGAGAQTVPGGISFGGSRTDKGCDSRATAQQFALLLNNRTAAAKILCTTKAARRAHLTMEDCLASVTPPPPPIVTASAPAQPAVQPVPPAPQVVIVEIPMPHETVTVTPAKPVVRHAARRKIAPQEKPCYVIQDQCVIVGHKTEK